jgi:protein-tyrosine phosphatase
VPPYREPPAQQFECVANFRDLAGHTTSDGRRVRPGQLFRSGHLAHATDSDLGQLERLGLCRIFDFRTESDIEIDGCDRVPAGAEHVRLPMPDPAMGEGIRFLIRESEPEAMERVFGNGRASELMRRSAAGLVRERMEPYAVFLQELARPTSVPALFHCSAGKDRAGWAGTVVLLALGVEEEQVIEQYLLSNRETERIRERFETTEAADWIGLLRPLLEVRIEYIEASFEAVETEWGSFDCYLHEGLGISRAQREQLRKNLLE